MPHDALGVHPAALDLEQATRNGERGVAPVRTEIHCASGSTSGVWPCSSVVWISLPTKRLEFLTKKTVRSGSASSLRRSGVARKVVELSGMFKPRKTTSAAALCS